MRWDFAGRQLPAVVFQRKIVLAPLICDLGIIATEVFDPKNDQADILENVNQLKVFHVYLLLGFNNIQVLSRNLLISVVPPCTILGDTVSCSV